MQTLAKFHRVDPRSVGLGDFGRFSGFYDRQIATFNTISNAQAKAVDVDTKIPVGKLPHFDEMVEFFSNKSRQPKDRGTFVHGDYKIDNMVFHKTEPRVIGVLDWEMATIGHPLSDLCNLTGPFANVANLPSGSNFKAGVEGVPTRDTCIQWYSEVAGWDPTKDLMWGDAFFAFRGSVIMQGIAARYAMRQASSARAKEYGTLMAPFAVKSWEKIAIMKEQADHQAKI